jgi:hypothetical protein
VISELCKTGNLILDENERVQRGESFLWKDRGKVVACHYASLLAAGGETMAGPAEAPGRCEGNGETPRSVGLGYHLSRTRLKQWTHFSIPAP